MQISARFFTMLREIVGKKEEAMNFKNDETVTLDRILKQLTKQYGKSFTEYVYDTKTGEIRSFLQFLVNGRSITTTNLLETELSDGDVLAIIPPVGGG